MPRKSKRRKPASVIIASIAPSILSIGLAIFFFILNNMVKNVTEQLMIVGFIVAILLIVSAIALQIVALRNK